jgi:hypothetical protein
MITTMALVKVLGKLYDKLGTGAPTSATVGEELDTYVDTSTGLSYVCSAVNVGPPVTYTWTADTSRDYEINLYITRAENDYLAIRSAPFVLDEYEQKVYPPGADSTAAEMVCYLSGIKFHGRGVKDESLSSRAATYDDKIFGYPRSIVGAIKRYQSAV